MEEITLNNYESFLLDHSEGNLSPAEIEQLRLFLFSHPELGIDLQDLELPILAGEKIVFDNKENLKKKVSEEEMIINYLENSLSVTDKILFEERLQNDAHLASEVSLFKQTFLCAEVNEVVNKSLLYKNEDDLLLANKALVYVENHLPLVSNDLKIENEDKSLAAEVTAYSKTILKPDLSLVFPDKTSLKKGRVITLLSARTAFRAAAALLVMLGLTVYFVFKPSLDSPNVVVIQKPVDNLVPEKRNNQTAGSNVTREEKNAVASTDVQSSPVKKSPSKVKLIGKNKLLPQTIQNEVIEEQVANLDPVISAEAESKELTAPITEKNVILPDSFISRRLYAKLDDIRQAEDVSEVVFEEEKKGFWSRAVEIIQQANKLGLKNVDAEADEKNRLRISFNSFSVEKH